MRKDTWNFCKGNVYNSEVLIFSEPILYKENNYPSEYFMPIKDRITLDLTMWSHTDMVHS
jgi:hypothetical protein